jgi:hypothetical protein
VDKILVVSSDSHGGIPTKEYKPYLEAKYHADLDDFDRWCEEGEHPLLGGVHCTSVGSAHGKSGRLRAGDSSTASRATRNQSADLATVAGAE